MKVRLTQLDGALPNLALMKLSHWHKAQGDEVFFTRHSSRQLFDEAPVYDRVYGSSIFGFSEPIRKTFLAEFPGAIVGGTGFDFKTTVEDIIGGEYEHYDYSIRPDYAHSLGFTQRGCRLKCGFCVVPKKEGAPKSVNTIAEIWRGEGHPKNICLLDNDFFGQPRDQWRARIAELNDGGFKVCFNQGLNVRLLDEEACEALATVRYYDDKFASRRLYTAWDNLKDEGIFFRGVEMLNRAGIPSRHLMVYMLIGWDPSETWERIFYRYERMVAVGMKPYPMVFGDRTRAIPTGNHPTPPTKTLGNFAGWVIGRLAETSEKRGGRPLVEWADFRSGKRKTAPELAQGKLF